MVATETGSVKNGYTEDNFTEEAFLKVMESVKRMVKNAERFGITAAIEAGINHPLYTEKLAKRMIDSIKNRVDVYPNHLHIIKKRDSFVEQYNETVSSIHLTLQHLHPKLRFHQVRQEDYLNQYDHKT